MKHSSLPILSRSPANGVNLTRARTMAIAALMLGACAFIPAGPAAAATGEHATYCLTGDTESDCSFTSLAQCEATASGGLGVCNMALAWPRPRDAYAMQRSPARSNGRPDR